MKTKLSLFVGLVAVVAYILSDSPFAATEVPTPAKPAIALPVDLDCVVTIDSQSRMGSVGSLAPGPPSGFRPDFSIQGKLLHLGSDWIVIKEGTYENWISRDRVVSIRTAR